MNMNIKTSSWEDEKVLDLYDLYERDPEKRIFIIDGDSHEVKTTIKYEFVRVIVKKIPSKKSKSINDKKQGLNPWY